MAIHQIHERNSVVKALYCAVLAQLIASSTLALGAQAQATPMATPLDIDRATPAHYVIEDIQVVGNKSIDQESIVRFLGFRVGDTIYLPGPAITECFHRLWKQGLVTDIAIYVSRTTDQNIILTVSITECPRLSTYSFEGITKKEQESLLKKLALVKGKIVTDELLQKTEKTIKEYYVEKGYRHATVTIASVLDPAHADNIQLKINVAKGARLAIHTIQFEGNKHLSGDILRGQMQHIREKPRFTLLKDILKAVLTLQPVRKKGVLWRSFSLQECWHYLQKHVILFPSRFNQTKFEEDKKRVISYYQSKGFRDAVIVEDAVEEQQDASLHVRMKVEEGRQYRIGDIRWAGNYLYDDNTLQQILNIKKGEVYNPLLLQNRLYSNPEGQDIASLYVDDGYLLFRADPVEVGLEGDKINLEIRIQEGPQVRVNRVLIEGNKVTHDNVIRRELRTLPGDKFSRAKLQRSQRELAQLNIFVPTAIGVSPIPNLADETVDIKYKVQERPKFEVKLSGGWSREFVGELGLFTNHFSLSNLLSARPPVGGGQTFGLSAETNVKGYSNFSLQFEEPWLGGKKPRYFHFSVNKVYEETRGSVGGKIGLGTKLAWPDDYMVLRSRFAYYCHHYNNYDLLNDGKQYTGVLNDLSFYMSLERDSTGPNPIYPKEGSKLELHTNFTPPWSWLLNEEYSGLFGSEQHNWKEYHQWMLDGSYFLQLLGDLVLNCRAHFGILGKFSSQKHIGPFGRFVLGGSTGFNHRKITGEEGISLRGYEDDYIAPRDAATNYRGGTIYEKFVLELRYPVFSSYVATAYALAFAEGGNTWTQYEAYNPFSLKRSVGVGLRIYVPLVIGTTIGFDVGYGFDKKPTDVKHNSPEFHFSIGMNFR